MVAEKQFTVEPRELFSTAFIASARRAFICSVDVLSEYALGEEIAPARLSEAAWVVRQIFSEMRFAGHE
jgi:hypothetical protein